MSINHRNLGAPGMDNAVLAVVDTGQSVERLLFDCGDGCLTELSFGDIQAVDHLFLSHLHMDHIGGFDTFFRCNYGRTNRPNRIWGPPGTARILQHRFQGFLWNLHEQLQATWYVGDIHPHAVRTSRFELNEAFAVEHEGEVTPGTGCFLEEAAYTVQTVTMEHRAPSIAYILREKPRLNVDSGKLTALGLRPGPWLKDLKDPACALVTTSIDGTSYDMADLRIALLTAEPGDSIAYLTDFLLDEAAMERLIPELRGCQTVVCESQYRHGDVELARRNYHMTTVLSAMLAERAEVGKLVLFHLSDRYGQDVWLEMLREAREIFPNTYYPDAWHLG